MDAREKAVDAVMVATASLGACTPGEAKILVDAIMHAVAVKYGLVAQQTGEGYLELERTAPNGGS